MTYIKFFLTFSFVVAGIGVLHAVNFTGHSGAIKTCSNGKHLSYAGSVNLKDRTIPSMSGSGSSTLENVTVQGAAQHTGAFKADGGSFGSLQVSGSVTLNNTSVLGQTRISGSLSGKKTIFSDIHLASNKSVLCECAVACITMKAPQFCNESLILELDDTTISGDIIFEGAQGQVVLRNGATVKGQVINGTVIKN